MSKWMALQLSLLAVLILLASGLPLDGTDGNQSTNSEGLEEALNVSVIVDEPFPDIQELTTSSDGLVNDPVLEQDEPVYEVEESTSVIPTEPESPQFSDIDSTLEIPVSSPLEAREEPLIIVAEQQEYITVANTVEDSTEVPLETSAGPVPTTEPEKSESRSSASAAQNQPDPIEKAEVSVEDGVPKITYSKETIAKAGEEALVDCSVKNVDLTNIKDFEIGWSKIEKEEDGSEFVKKISSNQDLVVLPTEKYEIIHPEGTYQYTLKIKNLEEKDSGIYRCKVDFGQNQIVNANVPLDVQTPAYFADYSTKSLRVTEGDAISIDCQPGGSPEPTVYWQRVGQELPFYNGQLWVANRFDIPLVHRSHKGHYVCYADNELAEPVRSEVLIDVDYAPTVYAAEKYLPSSVYDSVKLQCNAVGFPEPKISWHRNGERIVPSSNIIIDTFSGKEESEVISEMLISQVQVEDFSDYTCIAENSIGDSKELIRLEMKTPPSIEKQTIKEKVYEFSENVRSRNFLPIALECQSSGVPKPLYRWTKDGQPLIWETDPRMSLEPGTGNLLIREPNMEDNGIYRCLAYNELGVAASDPIELTNHTMIDFIREEPGDVQYEAEIGRPFRFSCPRVVGYPKPKLTWMKLTNVEDGIKAELLSDERMVIDDDGTLWISYIIEEDDTEKNNFKYVCLATSDLHPQDISVAKTISLKTVVPADGRYNLKDDSINIETFLMHSSPANVEFRSNEVGKLWCIFGGEPVPSVSWRRVDGKKIPHERVHFENHGQTLIFKYPQFDDIGGYECVGSNGIRNQKKFAMKVTVGIVPRIEKELKSQARIVQEDITVTFDCSVFHEDVLNPVYEWYFNSKPLRISPGSRRRTEGPELIIDSAKFADTGNYACKAIADTGYAYGQTTLNVIPKSSGDEILAGKLQRIMENIKSEVKILSGEVQDLKTIITSDSYTDESNDDLVNQIAAKILENLKGLSHEIDRITPSQSAAQKFRPSKRPGSGQVVRPGSKQIVKINSNKRVHAPSPSTAHIIRPSERPVSGQRGLGSKQNLKTNSNKRVTPSQAYGSTKRVKPSQTSNSSKIDKNKVKSNRKKRSTDNENVNINGKILSVVAPYTEGEYPPMGFEKSILLLRTSVGKDSQSSDKIIPGIIFSTGNEDTLISDAEITEDGTVKTMQSSVDNGLNVKEIDTNKKKVQFSTKYQMTIGKKRYVKKTIKKTIKKVFLKQKVRK